MDRLLNELGFPASLLARSEALANRTHLDRQSCLHLMSGDVPWSLSNIAKLCEGFDRQPGFFLDEQHAPLPSKAVTVPSAEGGESTVWCPPDGLGVKKPRPGAHLRHVTRLVPRMGPEVVGMYVFCEAQVTADELTAGCQYVLSSEDGLEVASFEHATGEAAIFTGCCEPTIHRIPLPEQGAIFENITGEVVGLIIVR